VPFSKGMERVTQQLEGGGRILRTPRVHRDRTPLVLGPGARWCSQLAEQTGQFGPYRRHTRRGRRGTDGARGGVPALRTVGTEHGETGRPLRLRESGVADRELGRTSGDDGHRAQGPCQTGEHGHGVGVGAGLVGVGDDGRESAVEVEGDDGVLRLRDDRSEPFPACGGSGRGYGSHAVTLSGGGQAAGALSAGRVGHHVDGAAG
jgi:hypothetical protein